MCIRDRFDAKYPKAMAKLDRDWKALTAFYAFPAEHWRHLRTTNPIESSFGVSGRLGGDAAAPRATGPAVRRIRGRAGGSPSLPPRLPSPESWAAARMRAAASPHTLMALEMQWFRGAEPDRPHSAAELTGQGRSARAERSESRSDALEGSTMRS